MKINNITAWKTYLNNHINNAENCEVKFIIPTIDKSIFCDSIKIEDSIALLLGNCSINAQFYSTDELSVTISARECHVHLKNIYNDEDIKNIIYENIVDNIFFENTLKRHIVTYTNPPKWFDYQSIEWLNALFTAIQQSNVNFDIKIDNYKAQMRLFRFCVNIKVILKCKIPKHLTDQSQNT